MPRPISNTIDASLIDPGVHGAKMIRPQLLQEVLSSLDEANPYLSSRDFYLVEIEDEQEEPTPGVNIAYRYNRAYQFTFLVPKRKKAESGGAAGTYQFSCVAMPGEEAFEQSFFTDERRGLLVEIHRWVNRLHADLLAGPVIRQFEAHSKVIDQIQERLKKVPDDYISREEAKAFSEGLDKLKQEITDQLQKEIADKEQLRRKIEELSNDITFLKETLESTRKRQWSEILYSRWTKWAQNFNLRQISAGAKVAKLLLPYLNGDALDGDPLDTLDSLADAADGIADAGDATADE